MDGMRCDVRVIFTLKAWKSTVSKVSTKGEVLLEIQLTGKLCTNLTFGGKDGAPASYLSGYLGMWNISELIYPGRCWKLYHR